MWADASGIYYRTSTTSVNLAAGSGGITAPYTLAGVGDTVPLTINAAVSQTANLQSWKVNSVEKAYITAAGALRLDAGAISGPAGLTFTSNLGIGSGGPDFAFSTANYRANGNLFDVLNNGTSVFSISSSGVFTVASMRSSYITAASAGATLSLTGTAATGGTAVVVASSASYTTGKLLSVKNYLWEQLYFDQDGAIHGVAASGGTNVVIDSDVTYSAGKLLSIKNNATEKAYFDFSGALNLGSGTFTTTGTAATGALSVTGAITSSGTAVVLTNDSRLSDSRTASDVYAWAKAASKPGYAFNEISSAAISATTGTFSGAITTGGNAVVHAGNIGSQSVSYAATAGGAPASDVYAWAKASTKPSYAFNEISSAAISATTGTFTGLTAPSLNAAGSAILYIGTDAASGILEIGKNSTSTRIHGGDVNIGDATNGLTIQLKSSYTSVWGTLGVVGAVTLSSTLSCGALSSGALTVTGDITATGNIVAYYSDARLKMGVCVIKSPLEKLMGLRGVSWVWDRDECLKAGFYPDSIEDIGVIAQEVQAVLPNAVGPAANKDYLAIKTSNHGIVAILIEAVKELKAEIELLKARV
jgi:hypothetical protein